MEKYYLVEINAKVLVIDAKTPEEALRKAKDCITPSEYTIEEKNPKDYE